MKIRVFAISLLCAGLTVSACSGGSGDGSSAGRSPAAGKSHAATPPRLPAGFRRIGGPENGFTAGVPRTWKSVDFSASDARRALRRTGIGDQLAEQTITTLQKNHAAFAADPRTARAGFASNLNGFCQPGRAASAGELKAQLAQIGARNVHVKDVTLNGRPASRTTYLRAVGGTPTIGLQYQIPNGDRVCFITITAKRGVATPFSKISQTIQVL